MEFRIWLESLDKSIRRKMARVVQIYLGISPQVKNFQLIDDEEFGSEFQNSQLFGKVIGYADTKGNIGIPHSEKMSALHEILHRAGFMPDNVSEMWNEGITQLVAEDIATSNNLRIPTSYKDDVQYVRTYLMPLLNMSIQAFARLYSRSTDKAQLLTQLVWSKFKKEFDNIDDWGTDPYSSIYESFQRQTGYNNFHLQYLVHERLK